MTSTTILKEQYSRIQIGDTNLMYRISNDSKIVITKSALKELEYDMRREYETAGFLLGNEISGKVAFDTYVPQKGITRNSKSVNYKKSNLENQMAGFKNQGYNSIAFVHLHPPDKTNMLRVADQYIEQFLYGVTNSHLNSIDRKAAMTFNYPEAKAFGFKNVFEGVFIA
ncbi:MAG: hypothetical protein QXR85_01425, partial [Candidatus Micrarchaeaceae archaeon]